MSIAAQKFAASITDCKGSDTTWELRMMYSGIASGRVLDGELLYTKILEVNLFAFAYRLFHRDCFIEIGVPMQYAPLIGEKSPWNSL